MVHISIPHSQLLTTMIQQIATLQLSSSTTHCLEPIAPRLLSSAPVAVCYLHGDQAADPRASGVAAHHDSARPLSDVGVLDVVVAAVEDWDERSRRTARAPWTESAGHPQAALLPTPALPRRGTSAGQCRIGSGRPGHADARPPVVAGARGYGARPRAAQCGHSRQPQSRPGRRRTPARPGRGS